MWARFLSALLGIWLMAAPAMLDYADTAAATSDRIVGPLVATMAITAMWDVTRPLRWVNFVLGFWLLLAPWVVGFPQLAAVANSSAAGICLIPLSLVKGGPGRPMDGGWKMLFEPSRK